MNYKRKREAKEKAQKPLSEPLKEDVKIIEEEGAHEEIEHDKSSDGDNKPKRRNSERVSRGI